MDTLLIASTVIATLALVQLIAALLKPLVAKRLEGGVSVTVANDAGERAEIILDPDDRESIRRFVKSVDTVEDYKRDRQPVARVG